MPKPANTMRMTTNTIVTFVSIISFNPSHRVYI